MTRRLSRVYPSQILQLTISEISERTSNNGDRSSDGGETNFQSQYSTVSFTNNKRTYGSRLIECCCTRNRGLGQPIALLPIVVLRAGARVSHIRGGVEVVSRSRVDLRGSYN